MKWTKNVAGQKVTMLISEDDGVTPYPAASVATVAANSTIRPTGGSYAAIAGTWRAIEDGEFEYTATQGETNHDGQVILKVELGGTFAVGLRAFVDIESDSGIASAVVAALEALSHDSGVTFLGLLIRLEALLGGAYSTSGSTRTYFKRNGTDVAFEGTYDNTTLARGTADVTGSE